MVFYKDASGILFFFISQLTFLFQLLFVIYIEDEFPYEDEDDGFYENPLLTFYKSIYFFFLFLSIFSHVRTCLSNPGEVTKKNNQSIIEFYYFIHEPLIKWAKLITDKKTENEVRKIIFETNDKKIDPNGDYRIDNDNYDDENNSDVENYYFREETTISDEMKKEIINKYRLKLTRCKSCYVARPINVHHCSICHACILEQDHHCEWINNCIGLFNKKYFILFNFYGLICVFYSFVLFGYYSLYKHIKFFYGNFSYIITTILCIIIEIIYAVFNYMMLFNQFDEMRKRLSICDYNNGFLLERSTMKQQMQMVFGGVFSFRWFFPFWSGGNYKFFEQICKIRKIRSGRKGKKEEDDEKSKKNKIN